MKKLKSILARLTGAKSIAALETRESMSLKQLYNHYYSTSTLDEVLVVESLQHLAEEMSLPVDKLRPTDRFSTELALRTRSWDSGYGALLVELQQLAKKRQVKIERPIETIDDYVRTMCALQAP